MVKKIVLVTTLLLVCAATASAIGPLKKPPTANQMAIIYKKDINISWSQHGFPNRIVKVTCRLGSLRGTYYCIVHFSGPTIPDAHGNPLYGCAYIELKWTGPIVKGIDNIAGHGGRALRVTSCPSVQSGIRPLPPS